MTLRLTEVSGEGCAVDTMQSWLGEPARYALSVTQAVAGRVNVTLASASGDYSCTFTYVPADAGGFTTGDHSNPTCVGGDVRRDVPCGDNTGGIRLWGQRLSARVSGSDISGEWSSWLGDPFVPMNPPAWAETKAEFRGSR